MPYKEHKVTKKYFVISEMLEMLEVSTGYMIKASTLRFWETELSLTIKKVKGQRKYTEADYKRFMLIVILKYRYEFTLEGIKRIFTVKDHKKWLINFILNNNFTI